tara:strand:- start:8218 stop:8748 length:531 start_codon:yes stop_codon:yes gene_type:complete
MEKIPKEVLDSFMQTIEDKSKMDRVLQYCLSELRGVDRFFDWFPFFQNMLNLGIIDEDEGCKEYRKGLCDFYKTFLEEIRTVESEDLSFISEGEGEIDKLLFSDNMIIGVCLINDVSCYSESQKKIVSLIGGCMLRKFKHDHTLERLKKMGDNSHLFEDPIDINERNGEKKKSSAA